MIFFLDRMKLLMVLSEAHDREEAELVGVTDHHAKQVAWLFLKMGRMLLHREEELSLLAVSALLHDSALNKYRKRYENMDERTMETLRSHCIAGESTKRQTEGRVLRGTSCKTNVI